MTRDVADGGSMERVLMAVDVSRLEMRARYSLQGEIDELAGITHTACDGTDIKVYGLAIDPDTAQRIGDLAARAEAPSRATSAHGHERALTAEEVRSGLESTGELRGGRGQWTTSGLLLHLLRVLDRMAAELAVADGAAELAPPPTLHLDAAIRGGYVTTFPQNVHVTAPLHPDCLRTASQLAAGEWKPTDDDSQRLADTRRIFNPLVCYHVYDYLADGRRVVPPAAFTLCGPCMRVEVEATDGLDRLEAFTMREIVMLGDPDHVRQWRQQTMNSMQEMAATLGVGAVFRPATDPFFGADGEKMGRLQRLAGLKYELQVNLPGRTGPLAIGSANLHGETFVNRFQIGERQARLHTGCVGFGLERWALAVLCSHGLDPVHWPKALHNVGDIGEDHKLAGLGGGQ